MWTALGIRRARVLLPLVGRSSEFVLYAVSWPRIKIPWSKRYNYKNFMEMVGPEGLEPSTKGFTVA